MKKILLTFVLLISSISFALAESTLIQLKKCLRYGTDVILVYNISNPNDFDIKVELDKDNFHVFDTEGRHYQTAIVTYGSSEKQLIERGCYVLNGELTALPLGKNEMPYGGLVVPASTNIQMRVAVKNIPRSVKEFGIIQLRKTKGEYPFCLNYTAKSGDNVSITDMK